MQVFNVEGMTCGHCIKAISEALQSRDPAAKVQVDLGKKEVRVDSQVDATELMSAIAEAGYDVSLA
ncbi:heavy-metal-associated domain-containing protein [Pseudomonas xionganensis]|uniref:Copper resistance protein CopZ n=1 Tax=Pseudomonas xionganensis TaxID=2654845 RepID=A0A6I4KRD3_9PSED|nr:cation transporter [Pseudomonas xionganensis]MVW74925.1 copper resistance protein CopZ [Pseudomonas xionganensis]